MSDSTMKPCPWCGEDDDLEVIQNGEDAFVHCKFCGSCGPVCNTINCSSESGAIELWNDMEE